MRGTDMRAALPPWPELAIHVLVAMFVDDTGFYWNHRLLHHPRLYKHVHKMHHEFKNVAWFTAAYAHPIEFFMSSIPSSVGPLITGAPLSAILFWYESVHLSGVCTRRRMGWMLRLEQRY
eukprot:m.62201 g.62201  ORF g.62201 m.62201 type:complete len:120 (-) comp11899_c0_seq4:715-1074(-)